MATTYKIHLSSANNCVMTFGSKQHTTSTKKAALSISKKIVKELRLRNKSKIKTFCVSITSVTKSKLKTKTVNYIYSNQSPKLQVKGIYEDKTGENNLKEKAKFKRYSVKKNHIVEIDTSGFVSVIDTEAANDYFDEITGNVVFGGVHRSILGI